MLGLRFSSFLLLGVNWVEFNTAKQDETVRVDVNEANRKQP